jgi:hypothetical protein
MTAQALPVATTTSRHVVEVPTVDSLTDFKPRTLTLSPAEWAQSGTPGLKVADGGEGPGEGLR